MRRFYSLTSAVALLAANVGAEPLFERQILFEQAGQAFYHIPVLVTAPDGALLAFCNQRWGSGGDNVEETHLVYRRSLDHGVTWEPMVELAREAGKAFHIGSAIVAEPAGQVIVLCAGRQAVSKDNGATWEVGKHTLKPNADNLNGSTHGSAPGIVLRYGEHAGRLVMPARATFRPYDDLSIPDRQTKCRSCVIYSDDHGATWQTSAVCLPGTGEAVSLRTHRRHPGAQRPGLLQRWPAPGRPQPRRRATWPEAEWSTFDGTVEINQGTNAGVVRFPPELCDNEDLLLFTNPAAAAARSPANPAVSGNRAPCA